MTEQFKDDDTARLDRLVSRFLGWKLPEDFAPDGGISFDINKCKYGTNTYLPSGTNLFHAGQAKAMLTYVLEDEPSICEFGQLERAFDAQSKELLIAVKLLGEIGAGHLTEFRRRAYPHDYPRPAACIWKTDGGGHWVACSGLAYPFRRGFCPDCGQPTKVER